MVQWMWGSRSPQVESGTLCSNWSTAGLRLWASQGDDIQA